MQSPLRSWVWLLSGAAACITWSLGLAAQTYPARPMRIIVGQAAGGATDITARVIAQRMSEHLGQSVVVENRPGASSSLAIERVATSLPDGYTLLLMGAAGAVQSALRAKLPYDLKRDLAPVSLAVVGPYVLVVNPTLPVRDVKELVTLARSQPGKLNYGSDGAAGSMHLAAALFNLEAKVNINHVPYKGGAQAVTAIAAGEVDMALPSITSALPLLEAGKLKPLAVGSVKRAPALRSVPTFNESGMPGYNPSSWWGVLVASGTPRNIIAQLNAVVGKIVNAAEVRDFFNKQGLEPQHNTPEQFAELISGEIARSAKLIKLTGVKAD